MQEKVQVLLSELEKEKKEFDSVKKQFLEHIEKEKYTIDILKSIISEKEQVAHHQEKRIHDIKIDYDKKLKDLEEREKAVHEKQQEILDARQNNVGLLRERNKLERQMLPLRREHRFLKDSIKKQHDIMGKLHVQEALLNKDIKARQKSIEQLQKQFDSVHANLMKLKKKQEEAEQDLKKVVESVSKTASHLAIKNKELALAHKTHEQLSTKLTYHSSKQINSLIKNARGHIKAGKLEKAHEEYNKIRDFYQHLSPAGKKKWFKRINSLALKIKSV